MDREEIREEAQEIFRRLDKLAKAIEKSFTANKKSRIRWIRKAQDLIVAAEA
jgi:hypothetical protein